MKLSDEYEADGIRVPLALVSTESGLGMIYVAAGDDPAAELFGSYLFTTSVDGGRSWSKAVAMAKPMGILEPGMLVDAVSSGKAIFVTYMQVQGETPQERRTNWGDNKWICRQLVSKNAGKSWQTQPLQSEGYGTPAFHRLSISPDGSRVLLATDVKSQQESRFKLVIEESVRDE